MNQQKNHKLSSVPLGGVSNIVSHAIKERKVRSRDRRGIPLEVILIVGDVERLDKLRKAPVELHTSNLTARIYDGGVVVQKGNRCRVI